MTDVPEVEKLRERVEKGINWLIEHDRSGAFHHWFSAGLTTLSPMPAQSPEAIEAWREYHHQRVRWEALSKQLGRIDPTWGPE